MLTKNISVEKLKYWEYRWSKILWEEKGVSIKNSAGNASWQNISAFTDLVSSASEPIQYENKHRWKYRRPCNWKKSSRIQLIIKAGTMKK